MPQVPYTGAQSVSPDYPATPSVHPNANPAAFGAATAAASERFGMSLEKAADTIFTRAYAMQEMDQQAAADNAHSAASDAVGKLVMDFRSKSGLAAKNAYEPFVKDVETTIDQAGEGLTSDYARKIYHAQTSRLRQYTIESAAAHAGTEFKNYQIGTQEARKQNAIAVASLHPEDADAARNADEEIRSASGTLKVLKGWGDEQEQHDILTARSQLVHARAVAIADTDPIAAKRLLDEETAKGDVSGEAVSRADQFIRGKRNQITSRVESAKLLAGETGGFGAGKVSPDRLYNAIIGVESSGNQYQTTAVTHKDGTKDRALGLGQVLESNLAPWLAEAGMPKMTPQQYLNDRAAQIKLIKFKLDQYQNDAGFANAAAVLWRGLADKDSTNGETRAQYLARFNRALAKTASSEERDGIVADHADKLAPGDDEFKEIFKYKFNTDWKQQQALDRQNQLIDQHVVGNAIATPGPDGKLPGGPEQITDPEFHKIWDNNPDIQTKFRKEFERNAANVFAKTAENQADYVQWQAKSNPSLMSPEDKKVFLETDFLAKSWPRDQALTMVKKQQAILAGAEKDPPTGWAMGQLGEQLNKAGIKPRSDEWWQIHGEMQMILQDRLRETKTMPKAEEVRQIGAGLLRKASVPDWWRTSMVTGRVHGTTETDAYAVTVDDDKIRAQIAQQYTNKYKREPTEDELQQFYAVLTYKEFYATKQKEAKNGK